MTIAPRTASKLRRQGAVTVTRRPCLCMRRCGPRNKLPRPRGFGDADPTKWSSSSKGRSLRASGNPLIRIGGVHSTKGQERPVQRTRHAEGNANLELSPGETRAGGGWQPASVGRVRLRRGGHSASKNKRWKAQAAWCCVVLRGAAWCCGFWDMLQGSANRITPVAVARQCAERRVHNARGFPYSTAPGSGSLAGSPWLQWLRGCTTRAWSHGQCTSLRASASARLGPGSEKETTRSRASHQPSNMTIFRSMFAPSRTWWLAAGDQATRRPGAPRQSRAGIEDMAPGHGASESLSSGLTA